MHLPQAASAARRKCLLSISKFSIPDEDSQHNGQRKHPHPVVGGSSGSHLVFLRPLSGCPSAKLLFVFEQVEVNPRQKYTAEIDAALSSLSIFIYVHMLEIFITLHVRTYLTGLV